MASTLCICSNHVVPSLLSRTEGQIWTLGVPVSAMR